MAPEAPDPSAGSGQPPSPGPDVSADDAHTARRRALRRLLVVCLVSIGLTTIVYVVTVGTAIGQLMSELMLGGRTGAPEAIRSAEELLGTTSRAALAAGGVTAVALALLQRREGLALVAGATVIMANLTTQILKGTVLERSDLLDRMFYVLPNSFPSGHVTAAASVAVVLLLVLPPILRGPTVIVGSLGVAVIGASTLIAGWHRMADAIGGVFVATAWGAGLTALLIWRRGVERVGRRTAGVARATARMPILVGVVSLIVGAAAYLLAVLDPLGVLLTLADRGGSPALLVVGVLLTTGASLLALGGLGLAISDVRLDPDQRPDPGPTPPAGEPPADRHAVGGGAAGPSMGTDAANGQDAAPG